MSDENEKKVTVVLGASNKEGRYSNMAVKSLLAAGHPVIPVNPGHSEIEGLQAISSLSQIEEKVHTLTMYIAPWRSSAVIDQIIRLNPDRVIFNPGTENPELEKELEEHSIQVVYGCTLVMLSSGKY